jgi:hypothetical protein
MNSAHGSRANGATRKVAPPAPFRGVDAKTSASIFRQLASGVRGKTQARRLLKMLRNLPGHNRRLAACAPKRHAYPSRD